VNIVNSLIAIGNALFLCGLCFTIGIKRTFSIFARRDRIRGTIFFIVGVALVVLRYGVIGMACEAFGFLNLFGNFLPTVLTFARHLPYLGPLLDVPLLSSAVDTLAGKTRPKYSV
jgi:F0F1-type ATP synthase membrane subunit c/vacuolar-type H+-ATPase subunit K